MEKTEGELLKDELFNKQFNGWEKASSEERKEIYKYADEYMNFLNVAKTEKEVVSTTKDILIKNGFCDLNEITSLKPGDKVYWINRNRSIYAAVIGKESLDKGLKMVAAHGDSPRLDLKQNPLYEEGDMGLLKTHYYGGIKKYQWTTIPLSMHGLIVKPDGEKVNVTIGENDVEPVFYVTDLPPHLSYAQDNRKLSEGVEGEELNVACGSIPYDDKKISEKVKLNILNILNKKYGIKEIDFTSSEIEMVPSYKARSIGFDESLIGAYGQDDKSCCYAALRGILDVQDPNKTAVCVLTDKEEVGFDGATGMQSHGFERFIVELLDKENLTYAGNIEKTFSNSKVISADVDVGYDPTFSNVFDKNNSIKLGQGVCIVKYTGARGKSGASEASAEFVAEIRNLYDKEGVSYVSSELGKVDKGGGGTIALTLADRGMDVLDCGIPVVSMHSPYELTSKFDVYNAYKAYRGFFK